MTDKPSGPKFADRIKEDHRDIDSLYEKILNTKDSNELNRLQNKFTWEVARNAVGEEIVLYPAFERYLRDGDETANKNRHDNKTVKEKLKRFQDIPATDAHFIPGIKSLMEDLRKHIKDEEEIDLVKLEGAITRPESANLAKSFGRTKMFVPSRSHPSAPDKGPFMTPAGLVTAPIDLVADMFRKWPEGNMTPNPTKK